MKITKDTLLGMILGIALLVSVLFLTGAINKNTANVMPMLGSDFPTLNVACSADGRNVYVGAYGAVYFSSNFGKDWHVVLTDQKTQAGF